MLIAAVPLWAEEFVVYGIIYSIIPNTDDVEIVGCNYDLLPNSEEVTIPEYTRFKEKTYYPRSIGKRAFYGIPIQKVIFNTRIRSIGEEAFWETNVASVRFGHYVNPPEEIGKDAFPPGVKFFVSNNTGQFKEVFASGSYTVINESLYMYKVFYGATDGNRKGGVCAYEEINMEDYYDWWMHLRSGWLIPELSESLDCIQCIYPAEWENNMLLAYMDSIVNSDGRTMLFPRQNPFINSITNPTGITGIFVNRYTDKVTIGKLCVLFMSLRGGDYANPSRFLDEGDYLVLSNVDFSNSTEFKLSRDILGFSCDLSLIINASNTTLDFGPNQLYDGAQTQYYSNYVPYKGIWTLVIDKQELTIRAILVEEAKEPDPYETTIYLLGHVNGNNWDPAKGVLMDYLGDGLYSTVATVDDCGNGLGYFAFSDKIGSWDDVNSGIRYGADTPDLFIDSSWGAAVYENSNSWATAPGIYQIDFTLQGMWMAISEKSGISNVENPSIKITHNGCNIVIDDAPLNSLVQIYNANGQLVATKEVSANKTIINMQVNGFYIVKVNETITKIVIK